MPRRSPWPEPKAEGTSFKSTCGWKSSEKPSLRSRANWLGQNLSSIPRVEPLANRSREVVSAAELGTAKPGLQLRRYIDKHYLGR
jgi:hypothetical protein